MLYRNILDQERTVQVDIGVPGSFTAKYLTVLYELALTQRWKGRSVLEQVSNGRGNRADPQVHRPDRNRHRSTAGGIAVGLLLWEIVEDPIEVFASITCST